MSVPPNNDEDTAFNSALDLVTGAACLVIFCAIYTFIWLKGGSWRQTFYHISSSASLVIAGIIGILRFFGWLRLSGNSIIHAIIISLCIAQSVLDLVILVFPFPGASSSRSAHIPVPIVCGPLQIFFYIYFKVEVPVVELHLIAVLHRFSPFSHVESSQSSPDYGTIPRDPTAPAAPPVDPSEELDETQEIN